MDSIIKFVQDQAVAVNGLRKIVDSALRVLDTVEIRLKKIEKRLREIDEFRDTSFARATGGVTPLERKLKKRVKRLEEQLEEVMNDLAQAQS